MRCTTSTRSTCLRSGSSAGGEEVRLEVDHGQSPGPPKVMITEEARRKYREKVTRVVLKQLERPYEVMRNQAMLRTPTRSARTVASRLSRMKARMRGRPEFPTLASL